MQSNWDGTFPQDVLNEILLRLPVKSLLRFKCVCKYWYTLIRSPGFVSKHLNHENNRTHLLLYYVIENDIDGVSLLPDKTLAGNCIPPSHEAIDHICCPQIVQHLVGPVDGLFFLHKVEYGSDDPMTLWNPATREFRHLPAPPPIFPPYFCAVSQTFGFGFDPLSGNYKVIWIRFFIDDRMENALPYFVVALYTLRSDTWRYLDPLTRTGLDLENSLSATCINGVYYWLLSSDFDRHSILSFDMSCEVFRDIEGPDHPEGTWGSLTLCNDFIALFLCQPGVLFQSIIDVWVMKEEGCWDKLLIVKPFPEVSRPLGFWTNNELLLESRISELVLYNYDTHEIRNLGTYGDQKMVFSYKESLLSVKGQSEDPLGNDFSNVVSDDITVTVPAVRQKAMVDKTKELATLVESLSRDQEFHGLTEADLAEAWQIIFDDPAKMDAFVILDGTERKLYVEKLVRGG